MLRLWCVKVGFVGDDRGGGELWVLSWAGWLGAYVWVRAGLSWCVGMVIIGLPSCMWGRSVEGSEVILRLCVLEGRFYA